MCNLPTCEVFKRVPLDVQDVNMAPLLPLEHSMSG